MVGGLKVSAVNLDKWHADFRRFGAELTNQTMKRAFNRIEKEFYKDEKEIFKNKGGKGGKWPDLSDKYRKWKERYYPGRPMMVLHGDLINSLTGGAGSVSHYSKIGDRWVVKLGTDVKSKGSFDYPTAHQTGQAVGGKTRKTVDPTDQMMRIYLLQIQKEIVKAANNRPTCFERIAKYKPEPYWDKK
jgi:hypothetical protein